MAKQSNIYTVRNERGQFLGAYRAYTAAEAIQRHTAGQNTFYATFRSNAPRKGWDKLTAAVEPPR